jgi:hypothetical protein
MYNPGKKWSDMMMINKWKIWPIRLFYLLYLAFFSWVAYLIIKRTLYSYRTGNSYFLFYENIYGKPLNAWVIGIGTIGCIGLLVILTRWFGKLQERTHQRLFFILMGVMIAIQIGFVYIYHVDPKLWDFEVIYEAARGLPTGDHSYSYYFEDYPNNIGITLLLSGVFQFADSLGFHNPQHVGLTFNIVMIDIGLIFLYLTARKVFGIRKATMALVVSLILSPFVTYTPIYYSDTLSLPMVIGSLYFYLVSKDKGKIGKLLFIFLVALTGVLGMIIKPTVAILFVAIFIHMLLTERLSSLLKQAAIIAIVIFGGLQLYGDAVDMTKIIPIPYKQAGYPYTHWIMMGLKGPYGFYDYYDVMYTESFPTKETRKEANIKIIRERIHNYGVKGLVNLFSNKNLFVWGDGTFFAPIKLNRGVPQYTQYHKYILPLEKNENGVYIYFCQIVNLSLILLLLISGVYQLSKPGLTIIILCSLTLFGVGLFFLVWEARSRYLLQFAPLIVLCSMDGLFKLKLPILDLRSKKTPTLDVPVPDSPRNP